MHLDQSHDVVAPTLRWLLLRPSPPPAPWRARKPDGLRR